MQYDGDGWLCEAADRPRESWLSDMPWFKANDRHGHYSTIRAAHGLMRAFDQMVYVSKGNLFDQVFYGDPYGRPSGHEHEEMTGFSLRYNTRNPNAAQSAACVYDGGGKTGQDLTSAWLLCWGAYSTFLVTPDGLPPYNGVAEVGLVLRDIRYVRRIANVPRNIPREYLLDCLAHAMVDLPSSRVTADLRPVIYVNQDIRAVLGEDHGYLRSTFVRTVPLRWNEGYVAATEADEIVA